MGTILLTAAEEDSEEILTYFQNNELNYVHAPLEVYKLIQDDKTIPDVLSKLDDFETIVYGQKRNAAFLLKQLRENGKIDAARNCLNLAINDSTFEYLESHGIAAV